jgi:SAM-dependent methyltransferase
MRIFWQYLKYFFYTAYNWSPLLAVFVLYHDIRGAFKYRIHTFAPVSLSKLTIINGDISKASPYEAVNYYLLETLLKTFRKFSEGTSIIDLGSGKGRAMVVAAHFGYTNITGIEFAQELCTQSSENMKKIQHKFPGIHWKIINGNVENYTIEANDSVFFMFNPFAGEVLRLFLDKLEISCRKFPRTTWFIYASPLYKKLLLNKGYEIMFDERFMNLEGIIARKLAPPEHFRVARTY